MNAAFGSKLARSALAVIVTAAVTVAHASNYDEVVSGDLSDAPGAPTVLGNLTPGMNRISGATVPSGTFDPTTHSYSVLDNDYVSFTVPTGDVLSHMVFDTANTVIASGDRLFFGIASGVGVSVDPSFTSAAGLLGWTLVGAPMIGSDVLPALGASAPPDFPAIGGATGFSGPLGSGQYTLWLLDGDSPVAYDLKLDVAAAVPEPSSWALMVGGIALIAWSLLRRKT